MRKIFYVSIATGVFLFANVALADSGVKVSFSKDAEKAFSEKYGMEEKANIEESVREEIRKALGDGFNVEVIVESATPNRPTMYQMAKTPSLSFQSFSVGGADLKGIVFDKNGKQLGQAEYEYSTPFVYDAQYQWTWHDADWAIERFAKVLKKSIQ